MKINSIINEIILKTNLLNDTPHLFFLKRKKYKNEIDRLMNSIYSINIFELSSFIISILLQKHAYGLAESFDVHVYSSSTLNFELNDSCNIFYSQKFDNMDIIINNVKFTYNKFNNSPFIEKAMKNIIPDLYNFYYTIIDEYIWLTTLRSKVGD